MRRRAGGALPARRKAAPRVAGAGVLALVALAACGGGGDGEPSAGEPAAAVELEVDLYFPGADGRLHPERRQLATSEETEAQAAAIVEALLAGPQQDGPEGTALSAPFDAEVGLAGIYLTASGLAYVDLRPADGAGLPAVGSTEERQIVFSLVNSLSLNLPAVERVVLLWNGTQPVSLGGHLDTRRPLAPDPALVASR